MVASITISATTLVIGVSRGLDSWFSNQIGSVRSLPAVKVVTMISSKLSANASMPPASSAVAMFGSTTWRKVWKPSAPRSIEASSSEAEVRRKRAMTLLYTTTMQNVAWPVTMVSMPDSSPASLNADSSAMPVTMPGKAIGRMNSSVIVSLPKKAARYSAAEARVPSSIASAVACAATSTDSHTAARTSSRANALANHSRVKPCSWKLNELASVLKAYIAMTAIGKCMNSRPPQAAAFSNGFPLERIEGPQPTRQRQIERDQHDRHHGERGRQRNIAGRALLHIHEVADEQPGRPDQGRDDVIAQRQREGEDGAGHHAGERQRQQHMAEGGERTCSQILRGLGQALRHALDGGLNRQDHELQPDVGEHQEAAEMGGR